MERGNVLVIGNSGVGKSTLINAVLGEEMAKTGWGTSGTTNKLDIYESEVIPFRIIDTVGFEPSFIKAQKAINAVKKWSKDSAKDGHEDNKINVIWFCIDGTSRKLFPKAIKDLSKATSMWESVPVIVVITKSYSTPERLENIEMVNNAFATQKKYSKNLRKIIPVVAATYELNDTAFASPDGITELIEATNELMPEGIKAGLKDVSKFKLERKRAFAQSVVGVSAAAGAVIGAIPIPIADALVLSSLEIAEINAIAKIYEIDKNETSSKFMNTIVEVGTVSLAAKTAISTLKSVPGINIAAEVLNAIIAASIVAAIGEGSIYVFEKIYLGEKTLEDIDWVKKVMEDEFSSEFLSRVESVIKSVGSNINVKDVKKMVPDLLSAIFSAKQKTK
ncbi:MAG: GTPase domain-containing protein [Erysipelotrichaceae bacterium]|nr:GTPase domain-containing protein [Erysipelotrichaceae bacterium]